MTFDTFHQKPRCGPHAHLRPCPECDKTEATNGRESDQSVLYHHADCSLEKCDTLRDIVRERFEAAERIESLEAEVKRVGYSHSRDCRKLAMDNATLQAENDRLRGIEERGKYLLAWYRKRGDYELPFQALRDVIEGIR